MSLSHVIPDSELKLEDVLNTFKAIGVNAELGDKGNDDSFYVIGNDSYGYTRMYVDDGIVTEFHQFGSGKRPIAMLFNCFNFIAYVPDDYYGSDPDEYFDDLENLPAMEFFKNHYPNEYEIRENLNEMEEAFEEDHPDLHAYTTSLGRTFNSYRFEYAYRNNVSGWDVTNVNTVIDFIYDIAKEQELV